ncbi:MAG: enoyl-CoA hydratase/isomerase family protein [Deltaproteobacteria bacterium]|nr:enoyl-CoA hydratase/isomerase family protein [Deltaproteobacteria bacterium]MCB9786621.1 enoyl-CoA hydratase/isomerase family protein [Deltaproteobacteria bacterium]
MPSPPPPTEAGVRLERDGELARVWLCRPPGNRFDIALLTRLGALADSLSADPTLRAVWIGAEGPDFSHGVDLRDPELARRVAQGVGALQEVAALGQAVIDAFANLPVPTIVSARGRIIGAGACLFVAADLRVASPDASLAFPEVERGMTLGFGILPRLVRAVGPGLAARMALTGQPQPASALPAGVVSLAEDPDAEALELARAMVARPPLAVRGVVRSLRALAAGEDPSAGDAAQLAESLTSRDFAEAVSAWLSGRAGRYTGR